MKHIINAEGKRLGRIASEAAIFLMGKNKVDFQKHAASSDVVRIMNVSKLDVRTKKLKSKTYTRYTGYPGGLRKEPMSRVAARRGYREIMRRAVYGMLPANKLRKRIMKNLVITE